MRNKCSSLQLSRHGPSFFGTWFASIGDVFSYQWHGITATYGSYISFFEGDILTSDDPKFPSGVSQQIMKNGLRLDVAFAKSVIEAHEIYTQFFQPAAISSYWTIGAEIGPLHL
jgi:hypothetical protein